MVQKVTALVLAFIIFITSCVPAVPNAGQNEKTSVSGGREITEEPASESIEDFEWPEDVPHPPEPNPINLTYSVEEGNSANVLIHPEVGGTLSVVDRNNVTYTLVIPPDALTSPEEISMTPLASVEGVPYGEDEAIGVVFEPEGLVFLKPADLSIEMPAGSDLSDSFGYATFAGGEDFYLTPWEVDGSTMHLSVSHFSVSALQRLGRGQINAAIKRYTPSIGLALYEDSIMYVAEANQGGGPVFDAAGEIAMKTWFYASVMPALILAVADTDEIDRAVASVYHWISRIDPDDPRFERETFLFWGTLGLAFINAFLKAEILCVTANAPEQALKMIRWLGMIDSLQLKNEDGSFRPGFLHAIINRPRFIQAIEGCFKFHLDFSSLIVFNTGQLTFTMKTALNSPLKITFDAQRLKVRESNVLLPYEIFKVRSMPPLPSQCSFPTQPGDVTMKLFVIANLNYLRTAVEFIWLEFIFDKIPQETIVCGASVLSSHWHSKFAEFHSTVNKRQRIMVQMEIIRTREAFAKYKSTGSSNTTTEVTEIKLIHTPGLD